MYFNANASIRLNYMLIEEKCFIASSTVLVSSILDVQGEINVHVLWLQKVFYCYYLVRRYSVESWCQGAVIIVENHTDLYAQGNQHSKCTGHDQCDQEN